VLLEQRLERLGRALRCRRIVPRREQLLQRALHRAEAGVGEQRQQLARAHLLHAAPRQHGERARHTLDAARERRRARRARRRRLGAHVADRQRARHRLRRGRRRRVATRAGGADREGGGARRDERRVLLRLGVEHLLQLLHNALHVRLVHLGEHGAARERGVGLLEQVVPELADPDGEDARDALPQRLHHLGVVLVESLAGALAGRRLVARAQQQQRDARRHHAAVEREKRRVHAAAKVVGIRVGQRGDEAGQRRHLHAPAAVAQRERRLARVGEERARPRHAVLERERHRLPAARHLELGGAPPDDEQRDDVRVGLGQPQVALDVELHVGHVGELVRQNLKAAQLEHGGGHLAPLAKVDQLAELVRIALVDEREVAEVEADVGNGGRRDCLQVIGQVLHVAGERHERRELVVELALRRTNLGPLLLETRDGARAEAAEHRHSRLKVVQLAQLVGDVDKVRDHRRGAAIGGENLGRDPVADGVEALDQLEQIGRAHTTVLGPRLIGGLARLNALVEQLVDERELARNLGRMQVERRCEKADRRRLGDRWWRANVAHTQQLRRRLEALVGAVHFVDPGAQTTIGVVNDAEALVGELLQFGAQLWCVAEIAPIGRHPHLEHALNARRLLGVLGQQMRQNIAWRAQ
jgi:hypothetical protein